MPPQVPTWQPCPNRHRFPCHQTGSLKFRMSTSLQRTIDSLPMSQVLGQVQGCLSNPGRASQATTAMVVQQTRRAGAFAQSPSTAMVAQALKPAVHPGPIRAELVSGAVAGELAPEARKRRPLPPPPPPRQRQQRRRMAAADDGAAEMAAGASKQAAEIATQCAGDAA